MAALSDALSILGWQRTPLGWQSKEGWTLRQISASVLRMESPDGLVYRTVYSKKRNREAIISDLIVKVAFDYRAPYTSVLASNKLCGDTNLCLCEFNTIAGSTEFELELPIERP